MPAFPAGVDTLVDFQTTGHASQVQGVQRITVGPTWYNLLSDEFGAADPTGGNDSTGAIQAWVNRFCGTGANAVGNGYAPPGNYRMTSTVTVPTTLQFGFFIQGAGKNITTFTQTTANIDTFKITRNPGIVRRNTFRDFIIIGPNTGTSGFGLNIEGEALFERFEVKQCWTGVRLLNCFYGEAKDCYFGDSIQDGLFLDTGSVTWVGEGGNRYSGNGRYGIFSPANCYHMRLHGDYFESNATRGLHYDASLGNRFTLALHGVYFEHPGAGTTHDAYIGPTAAPVAVEM